jgi:hypothetical protein
MLLCLVTLKLAAQVHGGKGVLLLQRIDDVLYGVDPISLAIVDSNHISGILVRVNANQPNPALDYSHFLVDCRGAMRMATLATSHSPMDLTAQGASSRARIDVALTAMPIAKFGPLKVLDASRPIAEFVCASSLRPAQAAQIAKSLFENGGPSDMRSAMCDLRPDGASVTREDVEVRFSDSEKVVSVNKQWLSSGQVTGAEISFGSGAARWRIDRNSAEASLVDSAGRVIFAGSCVTGKPP